MADGSALPCTIVNLSLGGALLIGSAKLAMEQRVYLAFSVPTMNEPIAVGATARWSDDNATGIQFDGLRAREVWGLNEYIELLP